MMPIQLRSIRHALIIGVVFATPAVAQSIAPIIDLPAAKTKTPTTLGGVLGIRETGGGKVLVNDAGRRRLLLYDTTLTIARVVFDSVDGVPNRYGRIGLPLIPYVGDSSLMADLTGGPQTLLVLDADGKIARTLALPVPDAGSFMQGLSGTDTNGNLVYVVSGRIKMPPAGTVGAQDFFVDSYPLMRADLNLRRVDTIAKIGKNKGEYAKIDHTDPNKIIRTIIVNPLPAPDEWAIMTDGSIAIVRGHDYHIDFLRADGAKKSTEKLPFDWRRVSDDDKAKLIDSARAAHAEQNALAERSRNAPSPPPILSESGSGARTGGGAGITHAAYDASGRLWVPQDYQVVAPKDIPDYWPAIRAGAVMADLDNHLWILPTTSAQSKNGELVYDVVNTNGELFQRVRFPLGRLLAGFGKGGIVYLLVGNKSAGFILERTKLSAPLP